jgi:hypothetical protein
MTLLEATTQCLKNLGYQLETESTSGDLRFRIHIGRWHSFRTQLRINESGLADWHVFLTDVTYPISLQKEVYRLADLINEQIVAGAIVKSLDDGGIQFRHTLDSRDIEPTAQGLNRFFSISVFAVKLWSRSYRKLLTHRGNPIDCMKATLIELDANDSEEVSNGTRKALLVVKNGGGGEAILATASDRSLQVVLTELHLL